MAASTSREMSNQQEKNTCSVIDHITGGDSCCVESNRISEERVISAVSNGTERVYVYENDERKTILQFPSDCLVCHSYNDADDSYFLFGLADGSLVAYKVAEGVGHDKKKKKKKKKNKHKEKDKESHGTNESKATNAAPEPDIFADLLGNHSNNKNATTISKQDPPSGDDQQLAQVSVLGEDLVVLKEDNLRDFLVVNNCLVTCSELESGWTLSVYQMRANFKSGNDDGLNAASDIPFCHKSPVYRTYFPKSDQRTNPIGCLNVLNQQTDQSDAEQSTNHKPCLKCVLSSTSQVRTDCSTPNKLLVVADVLFNELFGSESNLLDSPVILLGLPDGRVYQVPLKSLRNLGEINGELTGTKNNSEVSGLTGNILYHLQDAVINIHAVPDGTEQNGSQCLLLLGRQGKCVTISHGKKETSKQFDEHSVAGPVVSSCSTASHVVYCTQRALFALLLKQVRESRTGSEVKGKCAIESLSLGVGRVCDMDVLKVMGKGSDNQMQLIAALQNGRILVLNFPLTSCHGNNQSQPITASAAGQRMKELLHAINNVSTRMHQLSILSTNQDKVIEELNKACHLAGWLLGGHFESHDASVFQIQVQCVFKDEGSLCHVKLQCKVTNKSSFLLSHGWSLIVCVKGQQDWPVQDGGKSCLQITRTVQLNDFEPGRTVTVCIDLKSSIYPLQLPLEITCHLYFNLSDFKGHLARKHEMCANESSRVEMNEPGAVLTFASKTVDTFMVLRSVRSNHQRHPLGSEDSIQTTCNTGCDWLVKSLEAAADGKPLANRKSCTENDVKTTGPVSTVVLFKDDAIEALMRDSSVQKGNNPEFCVLQWLFRHNPSVLPAITGNQLETLTTDGKRISFVAVQKGQGSKSAGVELTMMAHDYESVCQLQEAVHRNLKGVFQRCDQNETTVPRSQLQNQLRHLQGLQRRLESVEDGLVSSQGSGRADSSSLLPSLLQTGKDTLEVYQLMRNMDTTLL